MIENIPLFIFALASIFLTGLVLDFYLLRNKVVVRLDVWWLLGLGWIIFLQELLSLLSINLERNLVFLFSLIVIIPVLVDKNLQNLIITLINGLLKTPSSVKLLVVFVNCLLIFFMLLEPIWGSDAWGFYLSKARAFWLDGGIKLGNIMLYWPYDQPLGWPLVLTWTWHLVGNVDAFLPKFFQLITYWMIAVSLWQHFSNMKLGFKMILVGLWLSTPFVIMNVYDPEYAGNADLLLALSLFVALKAVYRQDWLLASLAFAIGPLFKNDGLPIFVAFLIGVYLLLFLGKAKGKKYFKTSVLLGLSLFVFNLLFKFFFGLDNRYLNQDLSQLVAQKSLVSNVWYSLHSFREEFRQIGHWGLGWWGIGFSLVVGVFYPKIIRLLLPVLILVVCQIGGYMVVYYLSHLDQANHTATSIFRLVLHVYPIMLLVAGEIGRGLVGTK